jgi:hypothetical protein
MKCIAFLFSAAGTQSWTPEQDCLINYVVGTSNAVTVSTDPNLLGTDLSAPPTSKILYDIVSYGSAGTAASVLKPGGEMKIPVGAGQKVFVNVLTQSSVMIYYDVIVS